MRTQEAADFFGGKTNLARAIGISPAAVGNWGDEVPASREKSIRMAMRERAGELEREASALRERAGEV